MTPLEKLQYLADEYELIDDRLLRELTKMVGEDNLIDTLNYYFPDHEFDPDTDYWSTKFNKKTILKLEVYKVERFLKIKKNKLQQMG